MSNKYFFPLGITFLFLLSLYLVFVQNDYINRDALMYVYQAFLFDTKGFKEGLSAYPWPLFSFLIYLFHNFLGFSYVNSAYLINIILFFIAIFFYLKILVLLTRNFKIIIYGLLIIFTSLPIMDDYLVMILRDHGMWAGLLMTLYFYLKWLKGSNASDLFLWQIGFYIAFLFRPESLIFGILLSIYTYFYFKDHTNVIKKVLESLYLTFFFTLLLILYIVVRTDTINLLDIGRIGEMLDRAKRAIFSYKYEYQINTSDWHLTKLYSEHRFALRNVFFTYMTLFAWLSGLGMFHLFLFLYSIRFNLIEKSYKKILIFSILVLITLVFINFFATNSISKRYMITSWFFAYIFSAIALEDIWKKLSERQIKHFLAVKIILLLTISVLFLNILFDNKTVNFPKEVGIFIKESNLLSKNIYISDARVAYYSGIYMHPTRQPKLVELIDKDYEYLLLSKDTYPLFSTDHLINIKYNLLKDWSNAQKNKYYLYQLKDSRGN